MVLIRQFIMHQAVAMFKSYFGGAFDEDAIQNNFVLNYELHDGIHATLFILIDAMLTKSVRICTRTAYFLKSSFGSTENMQFQDFDF